MPRLSAGRTELLAYFDNSWLLTEILFSGLQGTEGFYRPPNHSLRHPLIFYYGHPAALYVNKMRVAGLLPEPVNAYFEHIFETGVDEMGWDDLSKNDMLWPRVRRPQVSTLPCFQLFAWGVKHFVCKVCMMLGVEYVLRSSCRVLNAGDSRCCGMFRPPHASVCSFMAPACQRASGPPHCIKLVPPSKSPTHVPCIDVAVCPVGMYMHA
jgi:hypothetical protein